MYTSNATIKTLILNGHYIILPAKLMTSSQSKQLGLIITHIYIRVHDRGIGICNALLNPALCPDTDGQTDALANGSAVCGWACVGTCCR